MRAINDGSRIYRADWNVTKDNYKDFDGLYGISVGIHCSYKYSIDEAYIWIEYEFQNYDDAVEALNDVL